MKATKSFLYKLLLLVCLLVGIMAVTASAATVYTSSDGLYTFSVSNKKATIISYKGISSTVIIPKSISTAGGTSYDVYYIGNGTSAVISSTDVKYVVLPEKALRIQANAFMNCTSLKEVDLSSSDVYFIGKNAFRGCTTLSNILMNAKVTTISDYAFYGCSKLASFIASTNLQTIGAYAFTNCKNLLIVKLNDAITTINDYAFWGCSSLIHITAKTDPTTTVKRYLKSSAINGNYFPETLETLGKSAFTGTALTGGLFIPSKVTVVSAGAFQNCKKLTAIYLETGVVTLGSAAFKSCTAVTSIFVPKTVVNVASDSFAGDTIENDETTVALFKGSSIDTFLKGTKQYDPSVFSYINTGYASPAFTLKIPSLTPTSTDTYQVWVGKTYDVNVDYGKTAIPTEISDSVTWKTNKVGLTFVNRGQRKATVTCTAAGTGYAVKAIFNDSVDKTINLNAKAAPTGVSLKYKNLDTGTYKAVPTTLKLEIKKYSSVQLYAATVPEPGAPETTWKSSDTTIATVTKNGRVTPLKEGTVTITATTYNGKRVSRTLTFYRQTTDVTAVYTKVKKGGVITITEGDPAKSLLKSTSKLVPTSMKFALSDTTVVTFSNKSGYMAVKPLKAGVVKIKGVLDDGINAAQTIEFVLVVRPKKQVVTSLKNTSDGPKYIWTKNAGCSGYDVQYTTATSKTFKSIATKRTKTQNTYTFKTLASGEKYKFQVRSYVMYNGTKYYGAFSDVMTLKVK